MTGQFKGDVRPDVRDSTEGCSAFREATAPDKSRGGVCQQYHHCTDIVPTILDCCGDVDFSAANPRGRSFKILAQFEIDDADAGGVIFAQGARFGGHSLFVKDRKLYYV